MHFEPSNKGLDPSNTNWLNILPLLEDKHIFQVGFNNNSEAFLKCGCASLTCLKDEPTGRDSTKTIKYIKDINEIGNELIDICIVDDLKKIEACKTLEFLNSMSRIMHGKGVVIIGFPNGFRHGKFKLTAERAIRIAGFKKTEWYLCEPSFDDPLAVYPYYQESIPTRKGMKYAMLKRIDSPNLLKRLIKSAFASITIRLNPFWGTLLVAYKDDKADPSGTIGVIRKIVPEHQLKDIAIIWNSKHYTGKQVGQVYHFCKGKKDLIAICKVSNYPFHRSATIRQEYEVLSLLSEHSDFFEKNKISIPEPLLFENRGWWCSSLETPVKGDFLLDKKCDSPSLMKHLEDFIRIQSLIQKYLTEHLSDKLPLLDPRYFVNSNNFTWDHFNDSRRVKQYQYIVQHGDYTDVNLSYDHKNKSWGIIDWEWTGSGFPPLFDIFHLILSLKYSEGNIRNKNFLGQYFQSFIDSFFHRNRLIDFIHEKIDWYCKEMTIDRKMVFNYFMDFLLYLYNKYRLDYVLPEYESMHKNMILYSLEHAKEFAV